MQLSEANFISIKTAGYKNWIYTINGAAKSIT